MILPESSLEDADQLYKRLEQTISHHPVAQAGIVRLSAGVTELRPDDDAISFFERADDALYRAKGAGKGTVVAIETPTPRCRERRQERHPARERHRPDRRQTVADAADLDSSARSCCRSAQDA